MFGWLKRLIWGSKTLPSEATAPAIPDPETDPEPVPVQESVPVQEPDTLSKRKEPIAEDDRPAKVLKFEETKIEPVVADADRQTKQKLTISTKKPNSKASPVPPPVLEKYPTYEKIIS